MAAGEEIVRPDGKPLEEANPLVPGSSPGGPTKLISEKVRVCPGNAVSAEKLAVFGPGMSVDIRLNPARK